MVNFLETLIINENVKIFILSMLPITELRFSIPYGILMYDIPIINTVTLSIIGNILIGVLIIYIIGPSMNFLRKFSFIENIITSIFKRTRKKGDIINRLKFFGLIIFVGIPLPLTGVWTGSLASYLFGLSKSKSVFAIICGVLLSSSIVTSLTIAGINIL